MMDNYDECGDKIKKVNCKYFHQDPDMTPNNYDLFFDYNSIPVNIELENKHDLIRKLKRYLPLSKRLHLNLETENASKDNTFNVFTKTKLKLIRKDEYDNDVVVVVDIK